MQQFRIIRCRKRYQQLISCWEKSRIRRQQITRKKKDSRLGYFLKRIVQLVQYHALGRFRSLYFCLWNGTRLRFRKCIFSCCIDCGNFHYWFYHLYVKCQIFCPYGQFRQYDPCFLYCNQRRYRNDHSTWKISTWRCCIDQIRRQNPCRYENHQLHWNESR